MKVIHSCDLYIVLTIFHISEFMIVICIIWFTPVTHTHIRFFQKSYILSLKSASMNPRLITVALLFFVSTGFAKKFKGYVITLRNDTISLFIKVPGLLSYGFGGKIEEVDTIDSLGISVTYDYDKIKEFGYVKDSVEYIYRFKPTKNGMLYFLQEIIGGSKTRLYDYVLADNKSVEQFFTFENSAGEFLFLKNYDRLETLRDSLSAFYSHYPEVVRLIATKFNGRAKIQRDISEIMKAVNGHNDIDFFKEN
jgi:hypothetical protein